MTTEPRPVPPSGDLGAADDAELMRRIGQDRQVAALAELYDRHAPLLLGLARRIVQRQADAEEVLQDVLLQVWTQASRYESERSSVSTWLVLLTRSRAIDRVRRRPVRDRVAGEASRQLPPPQTSPEGPASGWTAERRQRVRDAFAELPDEQREVLEMAYFRGMTQREIAEREGLPLGTVKTRVLLAMKKLRLALRDDIRELL